MGKDVDMALAGSGRVRKKISKSKRKTMRGQATTITPKKESRKARMRRVVNAALVPSSESADALKARQAKEWKEMKAKVALLKKDKKKLPTTGGKNVRVAVQSEIRLLMQDMELRHVAEQKAAGLHV